MKPFIISKRTPPPPTRGTFDRQLRILILLFAAASGALLLTACDSPTGDNTNTNGGKVTPKTYTTTLTGRVTDKSTGTGVPDAEVSASTAPENVVKTRSDGSFTLQVEEHTGTFTLTVKKAGYEPVTISIDAEKTNHTVPVIQLTKVYTTTVRGKVVTPARAADPAKGSIITTARVWSSINPDNKILVNTTDGSYSLQVANHTGRFTITAEYTAAGNRNYKTSDPKTVTTTGAAIEDQDIALNYGYTTTVTVGVVLQAAGSGGSSSNGVTVVITAENGHVVGRGITSGAAKKAVITVDHPGRITVAASRSGYRNDPIFNTGRANIAATARTTNVLLSLYAIPL